MSVKVRNVVPPYGVDVSGFLWNLTKGNGRSVVEITSPM